MGEATAPPSPARQDDEKKKKKKEEVEEEEGVGKLEQFIRFSTDAYGLERLLRLLQAALQVLANHPLAFSLLLSLLSQISSTTLFPLSLSLLSPEEGFSKSAAAPPSPPPDAAATLLAVSQLRSRIALVRRTIRLFRFLDAFRGAAAVLASSKAAGPTTYLEAGARSFNGMYLLLEALTLPDAAGLAVLGEPLAGVLGVEAQRFWFFSLLCGLGVGVVKLASSLGEKSKSKSKDGDEKTGPTKPSARQEAAETMAIRRKLAADALDLCLPGAAVGWVPVSGATTGAAMLVSTYLTGWVVWERVGREMVVLRK